MQDGRLLEQPKTEKELVGVTPHGVNVQPDVLAVLLQHLPQVHVEGLKDQAEVIAVVEVRKETQAVVLVLRVGGVEANEELQLLETGFVPEV